MAVKRKARPKAARKVRLDASSSYFDFLRSISDDPEVIAAANRAEREMSAPEARQPHPV